MYVCERQRKNVCVSKREKRVDLCVLCVCVCVCVCVSLEVKREQNNPETCVNWWPCPSATTVSLKNILFAGLFAPWLVIGGTGLAKNLPVPCLCECVQLTYHLEPLTLALESRVCRRSKFTRPSVVCEFSRGNAQCILTINLKFVCRILQFDMLKGTS